MMKISQLFLGLIGTLAAAAPLDLGVRQLGTVGITEHE